MDDSAHFESSGEITFRLPNRNDEPQATDSASRCESTHDQIMSQQTVESTAQSMMANMASMLKDVIHELQILKQSTNQQHQTPNLNNNTPQNLPFLSNQPNDQYQNAHDSPISFTPQYSVDPVQPAPRQQTAMGRQNSHNHGYDRQNDHNRQRRPPHHANKCGNIKIPNFTGKEEWNVWLARFETIADRNCWDEDERLDQLLPRMEDQAAQFVFTQLPRSVLDDYEELIKEMNSRYRVVQTTRAFAAKFSRRTQRVGETAEEFAADLKRLYDRAHGYRDRRTREEDLVRKFLDGLSNEEIRFEVEYHKEPENIDEAVFHVVNFIQTRGNKGNKGFRSEDRKQSTRRAAEADHDFDDHDNNMEHGSTAEETESTCRVGSDQRQRAPDGPNSQEALLKEILERLTRLEQDRPRYNRNHSDGQRSPNRNGIVCYGCQQVGHKVSTCPNRQIANSDQRQTHPFQTPANNCQTRVVGEADRLENQGTYQQDGLDQRRIQEDDERMRNCVNLERHDMHQSRMQQHNVTQEPLQTDRFRGGQPVETFDRSQITAKAVRTKQPLRRVLTASANEEQDMRNTKGIERKNNVGNTGWLMGKPKKVGVAPKLERSFEGPYLIKAKYSDLNYVLMIDNKTKERTVHHDKLKPYEGNNLPRWIARARQKLSSSA